MGLKRKNLVALVFASNHCYTQVVSVDDPKVAEDEVKINLRAGTWSRGNQIYKIGECRHVRFGNGVIGVYDRTDMQHLNSMVHSGKEATTEFRCDD